MYVEGAISELIQSLLSLSQPSTEIYIAHGRNRQAEVSFMHMCADIFRVSHVASSDLDDVYQTIDVDVLELSRI